MSCLKQQVAVSLAVRRVLGSACWDLYLDTSGGLRTGLWHLGRPTALLGGGSVAVIVLGGTDSNGRL